MNVVCKIDRIHYRVVYEGEGGTTCGNPRTQEYQPATSPAANLAFIQYKSHRDTRAFRIRVSYYYLTTAVSKKYYTEWADVMAKVEEDTGVVYVIKNLRRAMLFSNSVLQPSVPPPRLYCFDTYVKYHVKLPLYIYGRLSKRFRIPTADEFYSSAFATERLGITKPADYAVHKEHGQIRAVFRDVCVGLMDILNDSDSSVSHIVEYYFLTGYEASQIVYLYRTLRERKAVSDECPHPIQYVPKHTKSVEKRYECIIEGGGE